MIFGCKGKKSGTVLCIYELKDSTYVFADARIKDEKIAGEFDEILLQFRIQSDD